MGPRQKYTYISPISRFKSTFANREYCSLLDEYIARRRDSDPRYLQDVFDGSHFKRLLDTEVTWDGVLQQPARRYFEEETDMALGFSTDGVALYNRSRLDAWPILLTNYALPPELRTKQGYQVCCGIIPGMSQSLPLVYPLTLWLRDL